MAAADDLKPQPFSDEKLARFFHYTYESIAPEFGYKTRKASAAPWRDVPENNKKLMIAVAHEVYIKFFAADRKRIEELERERDNYLESARFFSKNSDYYSGLLDKIAENFGEDAFISDDGSVQDSPLRAKMPQLVADQAATIERLRETINQVNIHIELHPDDWPKTVHEKIEQALAEGKE